MKYVELARSFGAPTSSIGQLAVVSPLGVATRRSRRKEIQMQPLTYVTSEDGTPIAYDLGAGPAVILVSGASTDRMANSHQAGLLASEYTVVNYDRRAAGRAATRCHTPSSVK
jgi:hypothetical protein